MEVSTAATHLIVGKEVITMPGRQSVRLLVMLMACCFFVPKVTADLIYVPNDYPTISEACDVAVSGDTVAVFPGDYYPEYVIVPPGVSVIGMGADPTQVRVGPGSYASAFYVRRGEEPVLIENLSAGEGSSAVIWNLNPHLLVRRCHLVQTAGDRTIITWADFEFRECLIDLACWEEHCAVFVCNEPVHILMEDCVFSASEPHEFVVWPIWGWPAGSSFEFRNNTFIGNLQVWIEDGMTDFSAIFVNNIFTLGAGCYYVSPDTMEWRYNDVVDPDFWPNCGYQIGNFSEDPLFCDFDAQDYRLDPDSPCIGAGEGGEDVGARLGICWPQDIQDYLPQRAGDLLVSGPWPNPTTTGVSLAIAGAHAEMTRAEIFDAAGTFIQSLPAASGSDSSILYRWNGRIADASLAPSGVYYLRINGAAEKISRRVIVLR
jgi:hypothetical protein